MLQVVEPFLERKLHQRTIVTANNPALVDVEVHMKKIGITLDINNQEEMLKMIQSTIDTKFTSCCGGLLCKLALTAVLTIKKEETDSISVTTSPSNIICLDCPLEYNKGESHTNIENTKDDDFEACFCRNRKRL